MSCSETRHGALGLFAYSQRAVWKPCWFYAGVALGIVQRMLPRSSALCGTAAPALGDTGPGSRHLLLLPWYLLGSQGPR